MYFGGAFRRLVRSGYPVLTPVVRDLFRTKGILQYGLRPLARSIVWYFTSKEYTNYTYEISEKSKKYLADFLANTLDINSDEVMTFILEVEEDNELARHFLEYAPQTTDRYFADLPIKYGRRMGWYAVLRALKPRIVVESGIDRGVGTCVLAAGMLRNTMKGHGGKIIGVDINRCAGCYVVEPYSSVVEIVYANSLEFLRTTDHTIDMFIHDSDHSHEHEIREYELLWHKLSRNGVIISDNANVTDCLYEFAHKNSMLFGYWQEEVINHIASPGGIGLALRRS